METEKPKPPTVALTPPPSPREALEYTRVKAAVLDYTGISPETYHQRLRKEQYPPGARPRAVAQRIRDHCWRWLKPEGLTGPQVAEMLVLEQFTQILSPGGRAWVLTLMEDYLSAEGTEVRDYCASCQ
uniref:SCAN box domain-containing protein n=1 Tax=Terrapene triunguis TaxID=2587831 RepID=A0A674J2A0_9SAUR